MDNELDGARVIFSDSVTDATPEIVADLFCNFDAAQQARFFNRVDEVASTWPASFTFQLQWITDNDGLTLGGRRVMQEIGDYSHWGLVPSKYNLAKEDN